MIVKEAKSWKVGTCDNGCCLVVSLIVDDGEVVVGLFQAADLVEFSADLRDTVAKIRLGATQCAGSA